MCSHTRSSKFLKAELDWRMKMFLGAMREESEEKEKEEREQDEEMKEEEK